MSGTISLFCAKQTVTHKNKKQIDRYNFFILSLIIEMTVINLPTTVTMYFFYANIMNIILVSNYLAMKKDQQQNYVSMHRCFEA